jgi:hypothetical protein
VVRQVIQPGSPRGAATGPRSSRNAEKKSAPVGTKKKSAPKRPSLDIASEFAGSSLGHADRSRRLESLVASIARDRLTQTAFVQEAALVELQNRIRQLEWERDQARSQAQQAQAAPAPRQGGGFLGGLFGGGAPRRPMAPPRRWKRPGSAPPRWRRPSPQGRCDRTALRADRRRPGGGGGRREFLRVGRGRWGKGGADCLARGPRRGLVR